MAPDNQPAVQRAGRSLEAPRETGRDSLPDGAHPRAQFLRSVSDADRKTGHADTSRGRPWARYDGVGEGGGGRGEGGRSSTTQPRGSRTHSHPRGTAGQRQAARPPAPRNNSPSSPSPSPFPSPLFGCARRNPFCDRDPDHGRLFQQKQRSTMEQIKTFTLEIRLHVVTMKQKAKARTHHTHTSSNQLDTSEKKMQTSESGSVWRLGPARPTRARRTHRPQS